MIFSELLDLIKWDLRRNRGMHLDGMRAKLLLIEIRVEQYVYEKIHTSHLKSPFLIWYIVRFLGSIYQWLLCNSQISGSVNIGKGLYLPHPQNIVITHMSTIGEFATIYHNTTIAWNGFEGKTTRVKSPKIGNNVLIGNGVIIIGRVDIGDFVLIGAGTIVTRSVPDHSRVTSPMPNVTHRPPSEAAAQPGSEEHMGDPYSIYR